MRRTAIALAAILILTSFVAAQTPGPPQKPAAAQPNAEQKAKLAELAKTWDAASRAADAARDKYLIQLMATLAELGLKPSETTVTWNDKGEPVFNHVAPTAALKPEAKP